MKSIILTTHAGLSIPLKNGKTLTLKGFGVIDSIDAGVWDEAKENETVKSMLENGYIIENKKTSQENSINDVVEDMKDKQEEQLQKNKKNTGASIKKEE